MKSLAIVGCLLVMLAVFGSQVKPAESSLLQEMQRQYIVFQDSMGKANQQHFEELHHAIMTSNLPATIHIMRKMFNMFIPKHIRDTSRDILLAGSAPEMVQALFQSFGSYFENHEWQDFYNVLDENFSLSSFTDIVREIVRVFFMYMSQFNFKQIGYDTASYIRTFKLPYPVTIAYYVVSEYIRTYEPKRAMGVFVDQIQAEQLLGESVIYYDMIRIMLSSLSVYDVVKFIVESNDSLKSLAPLLDLFMTMNNKGNIDTPTLLEVQKPDQPCLHGIDENGVCRSEPPSKSVQTEEHEKQKYLRNKNTEL